MKCSHPIKNLALISQAYKLKALYVTFGSLAVVIPFRNSRPIALRHRFSPALPLSVVLLCHYVTLNMVNKSLQGTLKIRYKIITAADENSGIVYGNWFTDLLAPRISAYDTAGRSFLLHPQMSPVKQY